MTTTFTESTVAVDPTISISRGCSDGAFTHFEDNVTVPSAGDDMNNEEGIFQVVSRGVYSKYYHALYQVTNCFICIYAGS